MAGGKDSTANHRLSRLTAKLLRRPSTSSAKNLNLSQTRSNPPSPALDANSNNANAVPRPQSSSKPALDRSLDVNATVSPANSSAPHAPPLETTTRTDLTKSLAESSWCSVEEVPDNAGKGDERSLKQTTRTKDVLGQRDEVSDPSSPSPPLAFSAARSSPSGPQLDGATCSTPLAGEAAKRSGSLRRLEESHLASTSKDSSVLPLSVRRSDSRSTATRVLNAVDESGQHTNIPSPFPAPSSKLVSSSLPQRPPLADRRQSLVPSSQHRLIKTLLEPGHAGQGGDYFSRGTPTIQPDMISRKVWVKRAGSSPTLVSVTEEDLVDDLREVILRKYANSLGRTFDAPDILIKLVPRDPSSRQSNPERLLGPEESVGRLLDHYYPGGQTVGEALIIEVPQRRTPRPSPRQNVSYTHPEDIRPGEADEYFPPMHVIHSGSISSGSVPGTHQHSMSVITTGQLPAVPSPGSRGSWHNVQHRPKYPRQHTSSPTMISAVTNMTDTVEQPVNGVNSVPSPPSIATPPASAPEPPIKSVHTPPARVSSPRPAQKLRNLKKTSSGATADSGLYTSNLLDGTIPPINVLIVEDNTINLRLLEAFMKRLKVRWQTAMNGREAVNKWRSGGFHLVLMDIQLPVMNGLEATREIRRLERVNNIGVFSKGVAASSAHAMVDTKGNNLFPPKPEDVLDKRSLVKSPVIIVALTASSLQSDRDEALAAGCNDFLTKPVNMMWLEKKVTEWGCMQALIDFEGWRKWRGFDSSAPSAAFLQSSVATITGGPLVSSPAVQLPLPKHSQATSATGNSTQNEMSPLGRRESNPALAPVKPMGAGVYLKGCSKDSSNSSTSTIVPNGGGSGGFSPAGASIKSTSTGKSSSQTGTGSSTGTTSPLSSGTSAGNKSSCVATPVRMSPA
ncbi:Two-component response regulator SSK1p [Emydomyces testavorans]|uniref:Two-component response regulator SSK1p n=1 Tax=Emydomyces testavorans TaxID=2070801 RepID=A0AAF0DCS5_9EURO|nr:Two-component response regulator SSK1p [Emydomyces testavorans]